MKLNKQSKKAIKKAYVKYEDMVKGWEILPRHHKEFDLKVICSSLRIRDYFDELCAYFIK
jgi:hypothetical protein